MKSDLKNQIKQYIDKSKDVPIVYSILKVLSVATVFFALINNLFFDCYIPMDNFIAALIIIISVYTCYACRYNIGFFIASLIIVYANYSIAVGVYFEPGIRPESLYAQFSENSLSITILCVLIFEVAVLWMLKGMILNPKSVDSSQEAYVKNERNDIISFGGMVLYLLIVVLTFDFGEGGTRGTINAITEYRLIVLILGSFFSARKNSMRILWTVIVGVTSAIIFLSGNRVDSIGNIIALIILWYPKLVTFKRILLVLPVAVIAMTAVGVTRGGTIDSGVISSVISNMADTKLAWDTAIYAYIPSVSIVDVTSDVDFAEKVRLLWEFIVYTFVGTTDIQSQSLIHYTLQWHLHYGGCITPSYFYMWFGYVGALVFSFFIFIYGKLYLNVKKFVENTFKSKVCYIIAVYFVSSVCRWYIYGPNSLIRNIFVGVLLFVIVYIMDKIIKKIANKGGILGEFIAKCIGGSAGL